MRAALTALVCLAPAALAAETIVATRTLPSQTILGPADLRVVASAPDGAFGRPEDLVGRETRTVLYAERPIEDGDVGPAAVVERNQAVTLLYRSGPLEIVAEARALGRAALGEHVKVMNTASRAIVSAVAVGPGLVQVAAP